MTAILRLWKSLASLATALDRLAGLAHATADAVEQRVEPTLEATPAVLALENGAAARAISKSKGR